MFHKHRIALCVLLLFSACSRNDERADGSGRDEKPPDGQHAMSGQRPGRALSHEDVAAELNAMLEQINKDIALLEEACGKE